MKTILLLMLVFSTNTKTIYENYIHKLTCTKNDDGVYALYVQNNKYNHITDLLTIYRGDDVVGFLDEVIEIAETGSVGDSVELGDCVVSIKKNHFVIMIIGQGYKYFTLSAIKKIRTKIIQSE